MGRPPAVHGGQRVTAAAVASIPPVQRSALKEWAAVEAALESGGSILLLRKGGIYEQKHGFQVEHRQFWVFPTLFHQNPGDLAPSFAWTLEKAASRHTPGPLVRIGGYAVVTDALRIARFELLERISGLHPLADPTVHARFHYKKRPYLHVLIVRHHVLPHPHTIRNTPEYDGCVSWVRLDEELATDGMHPVLTTAEFDERRTAVLHALSGDGVTAL